MKDPLFVCNQLLKEIIAEKVYREVLSLKNSEHNIATWMLALACYDVAMCGEEASPVFKKLYQSVFTEPPQAYREKYQQYINDLFQHQKPENLLEQRLLEIAQQHSIVFENYRLKIK